MIHTLPSDILMSIISYLPLESIRNIIQTCTLCSQVSTLENAWKNVYESTFPKHNLIMWDSVNWKTHLQTKLENCMRTKWFLRQSFIQFICDKNSIRIGGQEKCTKDELTQAFTLYSCGKYIELPHTTWEDIDYFNSDTCIRLLELVKYSNFAAISHGKFIGWLWPLNEPIQGVGLV